MELLCDPPMPVPFTGVGIVEYNTYYLWINNIIRNSTSKQQTKNPQEEAAPHQWDGFLLERNEKIHLSKIHYHLQAHRPGDSPPIA